MKVEKITVRSLVRSLKPDIAWFLAARQKACNLKKPEGLQKSIIFATQIIEKEHSALLKLSGKN